MLYLIDGYNLLHALAPLPKKSGPGGLHHARLRLLDLLRSAFGDEASHVTVVFDARKSPPGATEVQDYHGIEVRYAIHEQQADDLIEMLIRSAAKPRQLTIVSDDHRIQQAARRRKCVVLSCVAFYDWLEARRNQRDRPVPKQENLSKPQTSTSTDKEHWLRAFADLDNSPDLKDAFNPFDFEKENE
jgi:predicted RNA-binding protein with PIN domain